MLQMKGSGRFTMPWNHQGVPYTVSGHWSGLIYHARDERDLPGGWIEYDVDEVEVLEFSTGGTPCGTEAHDTLAVEFRRDLGPLEEFLMR
jgi:hypothetical protein